MDELDPCFPSVLHDAPVAPSTARLKLRSAHLQWRAAASNVQSAAAFSAENVSSPVARGRMLRRGSGSADCRCSDEHSSHVAPALDRSPQAEENHEAARHTGRCSSDVWRCEGKAQFGRKRRSDKACPQPTPPNNAANFPLDTQTPFEASWLDSATSLEVHSLHQSCSQGCSPQYGAMVCKSPATRHRVFDSGSPAHSSDARERREHMARGRGNASQISESLRDSNNTYRTFTDSLPSQAVGREPYNERRIAERALPRECASSFDDCSDGRPSKQRLSPSTAEASCVWKRTAGIGAPLRRAPRYQVAKSKRDKWSPASSHRTREDVHAGQTPEKLEGLFSPQGVATRLSEEKHRQRTEQHTALNNSSIPQDTPCLRVNHAGANSTTGASGPAVIATVALPAVRTSSSVTPREFTSKRGARTCEEVVLTSLQHAFGLTLREATKVVKTEQGFWVRLQRTLDKREMNYPRQQQASSKTSLQASRPEQTYASPFWMSFRLWVKTMLSAERSPPLIRQLGQATARELQKLPLLLQLLREGLFEDSLQTPDDLRQSLFIALEEFLCSLLNHAGERGATALFVAVFVRSGASGLSRFGCELAATASGDIPSAHYADEPYVTCNNTVANPGGSASEGRQGSRAEETTRQLDRKRVLANYAARALSLLASADPVVMCDAWLHSATYGDEEAYCNVWRRLVYARFGGQYDPSSLETGAHGFEHKRDCSGDWQHRHDQWITAALRMLRVCADELSLSEIARQDLSVNSAVAHIHLSGDLLRLCGPTILATSAKAMENEAQGRREQTFYSNRRRLVLQNLTCMRTALRHRCAALRNAAEKECRSLLLEALQPKLSYSNRVKCEKRTKTDAQDSTFKGSIVPLLWKSQVLQWGAAENVSLALDTQRASLSAGKAQRGNLGTSGMAPDPRHRAPGEKRLLLLLAELLTTVNADAYKYNIGAVLAEALPALEAAHLPMRFTDARILGAFLCHPMITHRETMDILYALTKVYFKTFERAQECAFSPGKSGRISPEFQESKEFPSVEQDTRGGDSATRRIVLSLIVRATANTAAPPDDVQQYSQWLEDFLLRDSEASGAQAMATQEATVRQATSNEVEERPVACAESTRCRPKTDLSFERKRNCYAATWLFEQTKDRHAQHARLRSEALLASTFTEKGPLVELRQRADQTSQSFQDSATNSSEDTSPLDVLRQMCGVFTRRASHTSACTRSKSSGALLEGSVYSVAWQTVRPQAGDKQSHSRAARAVSRCLSEVCDSKLDCFLDRSTMRASPDGQCAVVSAHGSPHSPMTAQKNTPTKPSILSESGSRRLTPESTRLEEGLDKTIISHDSWTTPCKMRPTGHCSDSRTLPRHRTVRCKGEEAVEAEGVEDMGPLKCRTVSAGAPLAMRAVTPYSLVRDLESPAPPSAGLHRPFSPAEQIDTRCTLAASNSTLLKSDLAPDITPHRTHPAYSPKLHGASVKVDSAGGPTDSSCSTDASDVLADGAAAGDVVVVDRSHVACHGLGSSASVSDPISSRSSNTLSKVDKEDASRCFSSRLSSQDNTYCGAWGSDMYSCVGSRKSRCVSGGNTDCKTLMGDKGTVQSSVKPDSCSTGHRCGSEGARLNSLACNDEAYAGTNTCRTMYCCRSRSCDVADKGSSCSTTTGSAVRRCVSLSEVRPSGYASAVQCVETSTRERLTRGWPNPIPSVASTNGNTPLRDARKDLNVKSESATISTASLAEDCAANEQVGEEERQCKDVLDCFERSLLKLYAFLQSPEEANPEAPINLSTSLPRILQAFGCRSNPRIRSAVTAMAQLLKRRCRRMVSGSTAQCRETLRDAEGDLSGDPSGLTTRATDISSPPGYLSFRELQLLIAQLAFSHHLLKLPPCIGNLDGCPEESLQFHDGQEKPDLSRVTQLTNFFRRLRQAAEPPGGVLRHLRVTLQQDEQRLAAKLSKWKLWGVDVQVQPEGPSENSSTGIVVEGAEGDKGGTKICSIPASHRRAHFANEDAALHVAASAEKNRISSPLRPIFLLPRLTLSTPNIEEAPLCAQQKQQSSLHTIQRQYPGCLTCCDAPNAANSRSNVLNNDKGGGSSTGELRSRSHDPCGCCTPESIPPFRVATVDRAQSADQPKRTCRKPRACEAAQFSTRAPDIKKRNRHCHQCLQERSTYETATGSFTGHRAWLNGRRNHSPSPGITSSGGEATSDRRQYPFLCERKCGSPTYSERSRQKEAANVKGTVSPWKQNHQLDANDKASLSGLCTQQFPQKPEDDDNDNVSPTTRSLKRHIRDGAMLSFKAANVNSTAATAAVAPANNDLEASAPLESETTSFGMAFTEAERQQLRQRQQNMTGTRDLQGNDMTPNLPRTLNRTSPLSNSKKQPLSPSPCDETMNGILRNKAALHLRLMGDNVEPEFQPSTSPAFHQTCTHQVDLGTTQDKSFDSTSRQRVRFPSKVKSADEGATPPASFHGAAETLSFTGDDQERSGLSTELPVKARSPFPAHGQQWIAGDPQAPTGHGSPFLIHSKSGIDLHAGATLCKGEMPRSWESRLSGEKCPQDRFTDGGPTPPPLQRTLQERTEHVSEWVPRQAHNSSRSPRFEIQCTASSDFSTDCTKPQVCVRGDPAPSSMPTRQQPVSPTLPPKKKISENDGKCGSDSQAFRSEAPRLQKLGNPVQVSKHRFVEYASKQESEQAEQVGESKGVSFPVSNLPHPALNRLSQHREKLLALISRRKDEKGKVDSHLQSEAVRAVLMACKTGLQMTFVGFSDPRGAIIPQKEWFKFSKCFNLLPQKQMTLIYRRVAGSQMTEEQLKEALIRIAASTHSLNLAKEGSAKVALALEALLRHMKADEPRILRNRLHDFFAFAESYTRFVGHPAHEDLHGAAKTVL